MVTKAVEGHRPTKSVDQHAVPKLASRLTAEYRNGDRHTQYMSNVLTNTASVIVRGGNSAHLVQVVAGESDVEANAANNCFATLSQANYLA